MAHIPAFDSAVLRIDPGGGVEAFVSTPSQGQSQPASFRRLVGRALGVPEDSVRVVLGDTAVTPYGSGTFSSRSMVSGGGAVLLAAARMQEKLCAVAAARWEVDPADVRFVVRGGAGGVERTDAGDPAAGGHKRSGAENPTASSLERSRAEESAANGASRIPVPADAVAAGAEATLPAREGSGAPRLGIAELAQLAHTPLQPFPAHLEPGLEVHAAYDPPVCRCPARPTWPSSRWTG